MTGRPSQPDVSDLVLGEFPVENEWLDYNGHMNVGWYSIAFDRALDVFIEDQLGMGEAFAQSERVGLVVLQSHLQFLAELMRGERFAVSIRTLDADAKRVHVFMTMTGPDKRTAATAEQVLLAVDLEHRRSTAFPEVTRLALARLREREAGLPLPFGAGGSIGLQRKI